jgi:hypothetical protein
MLLAFIGMLQGNYASHSYRYAFHAAAKACDLLSM